MYKFLKGLIDIAISVIVILILLPFMIPIILILTMTGEKEVFYFQSRVGKNGKIINIFKFATMLKNSEQIGKMREILQMLNDSEFCIRNSSGAAGLFRGL